MDLHGWKTRFLISRSLSAPTGAPLFTYRTTKEEFQYLEDILKDYLQDQLNSQSLGDVARENSSFCAAFVFYASEWWKRRFDGHQWSWDPILQDLGASPDGWSQGRRSACVETGFLRWNINLSFSTGFHYLANIAFNGGLPLQLIKEARGSIGKILSRVLKTVSGNEDTAVLVDWIESLSFSLPQAYRRDEIYRLLATIALEIINLKREANLQSPEGAVAQLNQDIPGWRERLPITIDDDQTSGLINQLVSEVAVARNAPALSSGLQANRWISIGDDGFWRIYSTLEIDSTIDSEQLHRQFTLPEDSLEQWYTLTIRRGGYDTSIGLRKLAGRNRYRLERRDAGCADLEATGDQSLILSTRQGTSFHSPLVLGSALEVDAPWVFTVDAPESQEASLVRQKGGKVSTQNALVCIPSEWTIFCDSPDQIVERGFMHTPRRNVFLIRGTIRIQDPSGDEFKIVCGRLDEEYSFDLSGARLWDFFISPETAFCGIPKLTKTQLETGDISRITITQWRYKGGPWLSRAEGLLGPVYGQFSSHNDVLWRGKLALLPEGFRVELFAGSGTSNGKILLRNSGIFSLSLLTQGIRSSIEVSLGVVAIDLTMEEGFDPPDWVEYSAMWPGNPDSAKIRLPFPSNGVNIYKSNGTRVLSGSKVALQELVGMRVVAFSTAIGIGHIDIEIVHESISNHIGSIHKDLLFNALLKRIEVRLVDYMADIRRMLSLLIDTETEIRFEIAIPDSEPSCIFISHYANKLEINHEAGQVGLESFSFAQHLPDELERISIATLKLDAKGSEPISLDPLRSEGVHCGTWIFPQERLDPGPWLIFPGKDRPYEFQPILWSIETSNIKDLVMSQENLAKAIGTINNPLRISKISDSIEKMVLDPTDAGWIHAEWLASQTSHLHLTSLDLWWGFARSPKALAMLVFRKGNFSDDFLARFPEEFPILWELVPLSSWIYAIRSFLDQCNAWPETTRESVINNHLEKRTELVCNESPSMVSTLHMARTLAHNQCDVGLFHLQTREIAPRNRMYLFSGIDCEYQKMRRRHINEKWPTAIFHKEINIVLGSNYRDLIKKEDRDFRDCVVNAPIILAAAASGLFDFGWSADSYFTSRIRNVRDFDAEWFNVAFEKSIVRCLAMRDSLEELKYGEKPQ